MKIWHIGDTHTYESLLEVPENIDVVVHSGDFSNPRDPYMGERQVRSFIEWFSMLPIKHKICIAGNHESALAKFLVKKEDFFLNGIHYLENDSIELDGVKFWGSPHTPHFNSWFFTKNRSKLSMVWNIIPEDTDVIITHGPPKGILDSVQQNASIVEIVGDNALLKRIKNIEPKLHLFGHIHNGGDIVNAGTRILPNLKTIFSNGSVVTDGKFGTLSSNGNIFEI